MLSGECWVEMACSLGCGNNLGISMLLACLYCIVIGQHNLVEKNYTVIALMLIVFFRGPN